MMNVGRSAAWRPFLTGTLQLIERLDQELQQRSNLSLTDFEILSMLDTATDDRLRMSELANQVLVSRSRLTYRVDRLVEVDFVVREECEDDRRGMWAIITEAGRAALEEARVDHEAAIDTWFFDLMSGEEMAVVQQVMQRVGDKLSRNRHRNHG
jgi:DNA-binding MarR family transcriptional regulator